MLLYGKTDTGKTREMNQDSFSFHRFSDAIGYAIVCDGLGGQSCGEVASKLTCDTITEELNKKFIELLINKETVQKHMVDVVKYANMVVFEKALENINLQGMGTTLVLAVVLDRDFYLAHIGDSRIYSFKNSQLTRLTVDHSLVQELFEKGKIQESEMDTHPNKNMITRAVGVSMTVSMDYLHGYIDEGDYLLLCSDGLTNMCSDNMIKQILIKEPLENVVNTLIDKANEMGGRDNITAVIIKK